MIEPAKSGRKVTADELKELLARDRVDGPSPAAFEEFASGMEVLHVLAGTEIIQQGQSHRDAYVISRGRIRGVQRLQNGTERVVAEFGRGRVVGVAFLFDDYLSPGSAYAVRDCELLRLSRETFERLAPEHVDAVVDIAREAIHNLMGGFSLGEQFRVDIANLTILRASADPLLQEVAEDMARVGTGLQSAGRLTARAVEEALGGDALAAAEGSGAEKERLIAWLHEYERSHERVLYECDADVTPWTKLGVRHADRILVTTLAGETPDAAKIRAAIPHWGENVVQPAVDLAIVHESEEKLPSGTARWFEVGPFEDMYHIRRGRQDDYERLSRRLSNRAVGVVLGGGGARGIAHVGVLRAIEEAGIPIDVIGGASMGAIFAAGWARGWNSEVIMEKVREVFAPKRALIDLTLPAVALTTGRKLEKVLRSLYEDLQIEDLWLPFFCTSTDLMNPGVRVHHSGSLWRSVRASVALPGIFPPVPESESLLVDGGVLNNLPIDVMSHRCDGGPVIAVDVSSGASSDLDADCGSTVSGWGVLGRKLFPFGRKAKVASIFDVILQSTIVGSRETQERECGNAALFLRPPVEQFGTMQFASFEDICEVGYEYAREQLADWSPPE
ncbi:MAG: patatin-like phospholipase family protein [Planctomycetota bacterium]